jgi:chemotaxis family two-component system response regulator Rcp1
MNDSAMHILVVDDDETDRELFTEAAQTTIHGVRITEAENGKHALDLLLKGEIRPDLIVLDLNMPIMDGWETLGALKKDPQLKVIPVCILSTSNAAPDIRAAYSRGANLFQVKPLQFGKFQEIVRNLNVVFRNGRLYQI